MLRSHWKRILPVIGLLIVFVVLVLLSSKDTFPLYHEGERVFNGYSYLEYGNSINQASYSVFISALGAIPLLFTSIDYPAEFSYENPKEFGQRQFLYYGENNAQKIIFLARLPFLFLGVLLGLFIFLWGNELFNYKAGILALLFFAFSPLMIAYTPIVGADFALAVFFFLSTYFFWKFYKNPRPLFLLCCGFFFGLAVLTKLPAILLLPIFFGLGVIGILVKKPIALKTDKHFRTLLSSLGIILLLGVAVFITLNLNEIHPLYNFDDPLYQASGARSQERLDEILYSLDLSENNKEKIEYILTKVPIVAPHFFQGLYSISTVIENGREAYFYGTYQSGIPTGLRYLVLFLLKNPISFLLLLILSLLFLWKNISGKGFDLLFMIIPILVFPLQFVFTPFYGGLVYLLPLYPFLFLLIGNLVNYKELRNNIGRMILFGLVFSYIFVCFISFPYYLSYFNALAGGTMNGYTVSLDEFDYFQDLYRLEAYIKENNITNAKVNFGDYSTTLPYQDFPYTYLEPNLPQSGLIFIDANALFAEKEKDRQNFAWLREFTPDQRIGTTIFVYTISEQDLQEKGYV